MLSGPEASDSLVFVLKDGNTWYDDRGDNYEVWRTSCGPRPAVSRYEYTQPRAPLMQARCSIAKWHTLTLMHIAAHILPGGAPGGRT